MGQAGKLFMEGCGVRGWEKRMVWGAGEVSRARVGAADAGGAHLCAPCRGPSSLACAPCRASSSPSCGPFMGQGCRIFEGLHVPRCSLSLSTQATWEQGKECEQRKRGKQLQDELSSAKACF